MDDRLKHLVGRDRADAITASKDAINRYSRWRLAARFNPPVPATGGFPYYAKGRC